MRRLEAAVAAAVVQHADQVDHRVRAAHERRELRRIVDVDDGDVHRRQQDQLLLGALAVARRHADAVACRGQRVADVPADKAGAAENGRRS